MGEEGTLHKSWLVFYLTFCIKGTLISVAEQVII